MRELISRFFNIGRPILVRVRVPRPITEGTYKADILRVDETEPCLILTIEITEKTNAPKKNHL